MCILNNKNRTTAIMHLPSIQLIISSSLDGSIFLFDCPPNAIDYNDTYKPLRYNSISAHPTGVLTLDYSDEYIFYCIRLKMMMSAGVDREIIIWNPITGNKICSLDRARSPILRAFFIKNEIIVSEIKGAIRVNVKVKIDI